MEDTSVGVAAAMGQGGGQQPIQSTSLGLHTIGWGDFKEWERKFSHSLPSQFLDSSKTETDILQLGPGHLWWPLCRGPFPQITERWGGPIGDYTLPTPWYPKQQETSFHPGVTASYVISSQFEKEAGDGNYSYVPKVWHQNKIHGQAVCIEEVKGCWSLGGAELHTLCSCVESGEEMVGWWESTVHRGMFLDVKCSVGRNGESWLRGHYLLKGMLVGGSILYVI